MKRCQAIEESAACEEETEMEEATAIVVPSGALRRSHVTDADPLSYLVSQLNLCWSGLA